MCSSDLMRKKAITRTTAISEMAKFTSWNSTFSIGKISFAMRIFLISGADSRIDVIAPVVESVIRANNTFPKIRYMGKFATSPNFRTFVKTAARTHIISSGFRTDHSTPRTLRRYFSLKSFETREVMVNQLRCSWLFFKASIIAFLVYVEYELLVFSFATTAHDIVNTIAVGGCIMN